MDSPTRPICPAAAASRQVEFGGDEGLRIVGDAWGDPGQWPGIFLHGGGRTRHAWGGAAQRVAAEGWYALSLDLRGHGDSIGDRPPAGSQQRDRLVPAARRLTIPVLLVRGRMSDILSEAGAAEFLDLVPHAQYVDVSDAAHMVAGDRNDVFTDAVVEFLRRLPAVP